MNNVYSKLLCMCLGDIIEDFLKSDYSENCNIYLLDALQKIATIYKNITANSSNVDNEQCILLYKLYFYICLCIQGSKTINQEQLVEYFSRIPDNENIFNDIFNDIFYAVEYQKFYGQNFKNYKHDNKYNYLVCVSQFLNILLTLKDKGFNLCDDFIPVLEQSKLEICQFSNQTKFNRGLFLADLCKNAKRDKITS